MTEPFNAADLVAFRARTGRTHPALENILSELGHGPIGTAMFIHGLDAWNFDPETLDGSEIPDERLESLFGGADPTAEEVELWRQHVRNGIAESGEGPWNPALLWDVTGDDGMTVYAVVLQDDGGTWSAVFGPFASTAEALADLKLRGEVSEVSWPQSDVGR